MIVNAKFTSSIYTYKCIYLNKTCNISLILYNFLSSQKSHRNSGNMTLVDQSPRVNVWAVESLRRTLKKMKMKKWKNRSKLTWHPWSCSVDFCRLFLSGNIVVHLESEALLFSQWQRIPEEATITRASRFVLWSKQATKSFFSQLGAPAKKNRGSFTKSSDW